MPPPAWLDHIIILLPYVDLVNPPEWLTRHFTLTPGGRHADGKTENKLILFQDGSYIELIAFIDDDPAHRAGHWWGDKPFGIIDFAFTTASDADAHFAALDARLQKLAKEAAEGEGKGSPLGVSYAAPVRGGRRRPDGQQVEWSVTFPEGVQRGMVPFFCHDVTPRELRVPLTAQSVRHPCLAYGIKGMLVRVPEEQVDALAKAYSAILDAPNEAEVEAAPLGWFTVGSVHAVKDTDDPSIVIQRPDEDWQKKRVEERGLLLGDLQVAGMSVLGSGLMRRIDGNEEDSMGRIFLDLDLPPGWAQGDVEGVAGTRQKSGPDAGFPVITFENELVAGEPPFSFQAASEAPK